MAVAAAAVLVAVVACSPFATLNAVSSKSDSQIRSDQAYGTEPRQSLDVYTPKEIKPGSPVVVFFYGGSWKRGDKEKYAFVGHSLSKRGYVTVIPNYRHYPQVVFPAFIEDGASALAWIKVHLPQARNGVVVMGHSAGAHTAAFLALDPRYLQAEGLKQEFVSGMIGLAGPYGFDPLKYRSTRPIFEHVTPVTQTQPLTFACNAQAPILLMHGDDDSTVYPVNSRELSSRVTACGGQVDYIEIPGKGHVFLALGLSESFLADGQVITPIEGFLNRLSRSVN